MVLDRPEVAFRRATWLAFLLIAVGILSRLFLDQDVIAGVGFLLGGLTFLACSVMLARDVAGLASRVRATDFPPGIYYAIADPLRLFARQVDQVRRNRIAGVWGSAFALAAVFLGVWLLAGVVPQ